MNTRTPTLAADIATFLAVHYVQFHLYWTSAACLSQTDLNQMVHKDVSEFETKLNSYVDLVEQNFLFE